MTPTPIITALLRKEHREAGLYLESDGQYIWLMRGDETLAGFPLNVALEEVLHAADQALNWSKSGIEFAKIDTGWYLQH